MPNVLFIVNTVSTTSIPIEIANAIIKHTGTNVTIGALMEESNTDLDPDIRSMGVPIVCFGGSGNFDVTAYRRLRTHLKENNYDIIHTHHNFSGSVSRVIGKISGVSIVDTEHRDHSSFSILQNLANAPTLPLANSIISNSLVTKESFQWWERLLLDENQLNVVHNGIDIGKIDSTIETDDTNHTEDTFRIITVGRMVPVKNQSVLLNAFKSVLKEIPQAELVFVGDGPLRSSLEKQAQELKIENRIRFTGTVPRERVYELLDESDVYVMPSHAEGFGVAVVEAMAAGLPVVISDIPIFHEVVGDPGVYFDPSDSNKLAERILDLADDAEYRRRKGGAARKRARAKFSLERTAEEYYNIYKDVVERNT